MNTAEHITSTHTRPDVSDFWSDNSLFRIWVAIPVLATPVDNSAVDAFQDVTMERGSENSTVI